MKKYSTLFLSILVFSLFLFVGGVSAEGTRGDSTSTGQNQELRQVDDSNETEKDETEELETDQNRERNEFLTRKKIKTAKFHQIPVQKNADGKA